MKEKLLFLVKLSISIFLLYLIFTKISFTAIFDSLRHADPTYFLIGFLTLFIALVLNTKKWQLLLRSLNFNEDLLSLIKLNLIGTFYGTFLPGGQMTGEVAKCYRISKGRDDKHKIIFSVAMDRLISLITFVFVGAAAFMIARPNIPMYREILSVFIVFLFASFLTLSLFSEKLFFVISGLHKYLLGGNESHIIYRISHRAIDTLFSYRNSGRTLFYAFVWGLGFQLMNTLGTYFFSLAVSANLPFIELLWVNTLVNIVVVLPVAIMGLGVREISFAYLLSLFGIAISKSVSLSLLIFTVALFSAIVGGGIELHEAFIKNNKLNSVSNNKIA
ncbi:flippase-like domain-containing protein [Patescibacteria group bacterium]|nr:flippase-like domain-containing protein [Patescibacteria group bacterium]